MTRRVGTGSSRSLVIIAFAVSAVAMMLASPALTILDTDASLKDDKAGYCIKMDNPSESDIENYLVEDKEIRILEASYIMLNIFNIGLFETEVSADFYKTSDAEGAKIEAGAKAISQTTVEEVYATKAVITLTATEPGNLFISDVAPNYRDAADAIGSYFGTTVSEGDRIIITGDITKREARYDSTHLANVTDTSYVFSSKASSDYIIYKIDTRIELCKAGIIGGKTIGFKTNSQLMKTADTEYDYGGTKYADLTPASPCTVKVGPSKNHFVEGSTKFIVDNKEYAIEPSTSGGESKEGTTYIMNETVVAEYVILLQNKVNVIPASSVNVTVDKTYEKAEELYSEIVITVAGEKVLESIGIIAAVIAAIVLIVIIVIIIMVKRKK